MTSIELLVESQSLGTVQVVPEVMNTTVGKTGAAREAAAPNATHRAKAKRMLAPYHELRGMFPYCIPLFIYIRPLVPTMWRDGILKNFISAGSATTRIPPPETFGPQFKVR
jgi:hypothetical protein